MFIVSYQLLEKTFEAYKSSKELKKNGYKLYNKFIHSGKDKIGEFVIRDTSYDSWEIKVRKTGNRGSYIKLKHKLSGDKEKFMADGYKPQKYPSITEAEWLICAEYSQCENQEFVPDIQAMISRIKSYCS